MCISEGFPALPFVINEDVSRHDGAIRCRKVSVEETLRLGWRELKALKILTRIPVEF